jgi:hypothetical protein
MGLWCFQKVWSRSRSRSRLVLPKISRVGLRASGSRSRSRSLTATVTESGPCAPASLVGGTDFTSPRPGCVLWARDSKKDDSTHYSCDVNSLRSQIAAYI